MNKTQLKSDLQDWINVDNRIGNIEKEKKLVSDKFEKELSRDNDIRMKIREYGLKNVAVVLKNFVVVINLNGQLQKFERLV